jgi:hypothetical protein
LSSFILGNDPRTFEADHVGAMTRRPRMYVFHSSRLIEHPQYFPICARASGLKIQDNWDDDDIDDEFTTQLRAELSKSG